MTGSAPSRVTLAWALERLGVGLLAVWLMVRVFLAHVSIPGPAPGTNLFVGLLAWMGAGAYLAGRTAGGGWTFRPTGLEGLVLALAVVLLAAPWRAVGGGREGYALTAIDGTFAFVTALMAFVFVADQCASGFREVWRGVFWGVAATAVGYGVVQVVYLFPQFASMTEQEAAAIVGPSAAEEFLMRVRDREPVGTFLTSNIFAGFLAMWLPHVAGRLWDGRRSAGLRQIGVAALGALGLFLLVKTGSRGGWVAATAGVAAFALLMGARRRGWAPARLVALGLVAVAGAAVALGPGGGWRWLTERFPTMGYRAEYWKAAQAMWRESPWLGVGLYQYGEHYPRYRGATLEETRMVHNDYLQMGAEAGWVGLAIFATLLAVMVRRGLSWVREDPRESADPPLDGLAFAGVGLAGFAGFALAYVLGGTFNDIGGTPLLAGLLFLVFLAGAAVGAGGGTASRLAWPAALVAYLVHAAVDFDMFAFGFAALFWVQAAVALSEEAGELPVGRRPTAVLAGGMLALVLALSGLVAPRWLAAEAALAQARSAAKAAGATAAVRIEGLERGIEAARRALEGNPLDAQAAAVLAELQWTIWQERAASPGIRTPDLRASESGLEDAHTILYLHGLRRRAGDSEMHWRLGYTMMLMAELNARIAREAADSGSIAEAHGRLLTLVPMAKSQFDEAVRRNPNHPRYRYWRARALAAWMQLQPQNRGLLREEAEREYAQAQRLARMARLRRLQAYWEPDARDELEPIMGGGAP